MRLVTKAREDLGDYDKIGKGVRFFDKEPRRLDMNDWKKARAARP